LVFTTLNWTIDFPNSEVLPLAKITSDRIPFKIAISTKIPKSKIFRFENFWVELNNFFETVKNSWVKGFRETNSVKKISSSFKRLRVDLKEWRRNLSELGQLISNYNTVICFLDGQEETRFLFNPEVNLRFLIRRQLKNLLHQKNIYWRNRFKSNKVKLGDECTKFFHSMETISFRRNAISQLLNDSGAWIQDHDGKAALL
jgi:hypothetical protein